MSFIGTVVTIGLVWFFGPSSLIGSLLVMWFIYSIGHSDAMQGR
jgi:hypothetical protein